MEGPVVPKVKRSAPTCSRVATFTTVHLPVTGNAYASTEGGAPDLQPVPKPGAGFGVPKLNHLMRCALNVHATKPGLARYYGEQLFQFVLKCTDVR
eukprot:g7318.t1